MIEKDTNLYSAIENAIYAIFEGEIPMDDPTETVEMFIKAVNNDLEEFADDED